MKLSEILHRSSINPERVFTREAEEGLYKVSVNKKGDLIQELFEPDGKKRRVAIKLSIHDEDEWEEERTAIDLSTAIRRYFNEGIGLLIVTADKKEKVIAPNEVLILNKADVTDVTIYPLYPDYFPDKPVHVFPEIEPVMDMEENTWNEKKTSTSISSYMDEVEELGF